MTAMFFLGSIVGGCTFLVIADALDWFGARHRQELHDLTNHLATARLRKKKSK